MLNRVCMLKIIEFGFSTIICKHDVSGYSEIFHKCQRWGFWSDPDRSGCHKENKKKIIKIGQLLTKCWYPRSVSLITAKEQSTAKNFFCKMCQNQCGRISAIPGHTVKYDIPKCIYFSRENNFLHYILNYINIFSVKLTKNISFYYFWLKKIVKVIQNQYSVINSHPYCKISGFGFTF